MAGEGITARDVGAGLLFGFISAPTIGIQIPSVIKKTLGFVPTEGQVYVSPEEVGLGMVATFVAAMFIGGYLSRHYRLTSE